MKLVRTSYACPEQYDVFDEGVQIGYLRLRHGHFTAEYPDVWGKLVYEADTIGDGIFENGERDLHLAKALGAIMLAHILNIEVVDND